MTEPLPAPVSLGARAPHFKNPRAQHGFRVRTCSIAGVGSYVPERVLTNAELAKKLGTTEDWILTRTGIRERRIAADDECTSDMAAKAATRAMARAGVTAEQIELIVVATNTPDMQFPATACLVQSRTGARRTPAFDVKAAGSGFIFALEVGHQFIMSHACDTVLVIGAEKLSAMVDWQDRDTAVLFGDGAGAAVLRHLPGRQGLLTTCMGGNAEMEGKAMLFKEFAGIDAYPICLCTKDTDEIVATVKHLSVGFGGINLEDIAAPRCFDIERKLQEQLNIPAFHDDQHGTAVVVLAALLTALRLTKQKLERLRIVISGAGAAGVAVTRILLRGGARDIIVCDREGILHEGRLPELNESKAWLARHTNPRRLRGRLEDALGSANVFIGVSGPGTLHAKHLKRMARRPIVFALANPTPEIMPEEAARVAFIVATGRSDYPNQINNVLAFPGIFRGALNVRARQITEDMKQAAARAIAGCIAPRELNPEYIVPSVFNRDVVQRVADAVQRAAIKAGVARRKK